MVPASSEWQFRPTTVAVNAKNITATAVGVGSVHSCAVGAATVSPFNVQCWGDDFYGQLGDKSGTTGYAYAAVHALVLKNASAMAWAEATPVR